MPELALPISSPFPINGASLLPASASASNETAFKKSESFEKLASPYSPMLVLCPEGFIRHATGAARRLLQYRPEQRFDDYFFTHVHGRNLHRVMRDLAAMVKRGSESASWLLRLRTGRDRWRWYRAEATNRLDMATPAVTVRLSNLHDW